jgi:hypothetical protein
VLRWRWRRANACKRSRAVLTWLQWGGDPTPNPRNPRRWFLGDCPTDAARFSCLVAGRRFLVHSRRILDPAGQPIPRLALRSRPSLGSLSMITMMTQKAQQSIDVSACARCKRPIHRRPAHRGRDVVDAPPLNGAQSPISSSCPIPTMLKLPGPAANAPATLISLCSH